MNRQRTLLPGPRAADEHGSMKRPWLAAALSLLGAACQTPAPRIPFTDDGTRWYASAVGGEWIVNKTFAEDTNFVGLEVVLGPPATGGWAWEAGFRYASGDSDGTRRVYDADSTFPIGKNDLNTIVPSEREIQFYELDIGVRQIYRPDAWLQPYIGVGAALLQSRSEEAFVQPAITTTPPMGETNPYPVDTPLRDHERGEIRPGIYMRTGLIWNALRNQIREGTEFPIAFDVRGLLSVDYSYLEFSFAFGFGK